MEEQKTKMQPIIDRLIVFNYTFWPTFLTERPFNAILASHRQPHCNQDHGLPLQQASGSHQAIGIRCLDADQARTMHERKDCEGHGRLWRTTTRRHFPTADLRPHPL